MDVHKKLVPSRLIAEGRVGVVYILERDRIKGKRTEFYKATGSRRGKSLLDSEGVLHGVKVFIGSARLIDTMSSNLYHTRFDFIYAEYERAEDVEQAGVLLSLREIPVFAALRFEDESLREVLSFDECYTLLREYEDELMCGIVKRFKLREKLYRKNPPPIDGNEEGDTWYYAHASAHNDMDAIIRKARELCARLVVPNIGRKYKR